MLPENLVQIIIETRNRIQTKVKIIFRNFAIVVVGNKKSQTFMAASFNITSISEKMTEIKFFKYHVIKIKCFV